MEKYNKTYRIRTEVGKDTHLHVKLEQDYDVIEIMSLKINQKNAYRLHTSDYGVIAGRVLANDAFGVPNAKVSVFISIDETDYNDVVKKALYPYHTTNSKNDKGVKYNLLPNEQLTDCHTIIGTFPEKQYMLDNNSVLEIFEKYYKFTTRTNDAGDYMIFGVPIGTHNIHVDIDLSDIGILSQKPRDLIYKGYNIGQFENPNKFKYETNLNNLAQYISQDKSTEVIPFWGDEDEQVGITRCDINIQYKFEPTCVFMGSVVSDSASHGISKKCIPFPGTGAMDEITTGSGTIEMIRKTPDGLVEEFQIQGTQLINGDGIWCYQIPMNLDYMMTDEFGNMVPTNDPNKGIPTRTKVRFRVSMQDFDNNNVNIFRGKMLIPNNPDIYSAKCEDELDYQFGTLTKDSSFRDLFWNGVYSVKSFIPRIQKGTNWKHEKFTGFKRVNYYGDKNPIPYNNIRIRIPFMYTIICALIHMMVHLIGWLNWVFKLCAGIFVTQKDENGEKTSGSYITLSGELCNDNLTNLCIIPGIDIRSIAKNNKKNKTTLLGVAMLKHCKEAGSEGINHSLLNDETAIIKDEQAIDTTNKSKQSKSKQIKVTTTKEDDDDKEYTLNITGLRVTDSVDYLISCIEMNLAQEFKVIQFDFYNDWLNGVIYIPKWARVIRRKFSFSWGGKTYNIGGKVKACNENYNGQSRNLVQQCGLSYNLMTHNINTPVGCKSDDSALQCHKSLEVRKDFEIFKHGGLINSVKTTRSQYVYYYKPYENSNGKNVRLFATDIILLGTLNDCNKWGIPNNFNELVSSTYQMPPNLALTDADIEGNDYETNTDKNKKITLYVNESNNKIYDIEIESCYSGINPMEESGNYTEVAGINWNYTGPMQESASEKTVLFKPGGHFLGLSCRSSETTIKTCVNLSRICEYGVWMSQRQDLNIPSQTTPTGGNNTFPKTYATVPTGLISKDEISDSNYRSIFATMNHNKLRTTIDKETGYLNYDFITVNTNNFGGDLNQQIIKNNEESYNRKIADSIVERYYSFSDDDNYVRDSNPISTTVSETQIMRTGEFTDKEYLKFRFGLKDDEYTETELKKRFLIVDSPNGSIPMYDNSFYFYFGLHEGKTALDEFKKQYYAKCNKMDTLIQEDTSIYLNNLIVTNDGINNVIGSGAMEFNVDSPLFNDGALFVKLYNDENELLEEKVILNNTTKCFFDGLKYGDYHVIIHNNDDTQQKDFNVFINTIKVSAKLTATDFYKDVSILPLETCFQGNRDIYGGYITINDNMITYKQGGVVDVENIDVFTSDYINRIIISGRTQNIVYSNNKNNPTEFTFNNLIANASMPLGDFKIPVPFENEKYVVFIETYLDDKGKLSKKETENIYRWNIGEVEINNANPLDFYYNDISYNNILKQYSQHVTDMTGAIDCNGWWNPIGSFNWTLENNLTQWRIKEQLYQNDLNTPHSISLTYSGGIIPYIEDISGSTQNNLSTIVRLNRSDLNNITIPTINYGRDNKKRPHFSYQLKDKNGVEPCQTTPINGSFIMPIIYKPFFIKMGIWYFNETNKYYLYGNVYNGRTWDYMDEGFNFMELNNLPMSSIYRLSKPDTTLEIDEPVAIVGNDTGGYDYNGPHWKYNGRKHIITKEIEPITYGLYTNDMLQSVSLSIGSKHTEDNVVYSDITNIIKDRMKFYNFTLTGKTFGDDYLIQMDVISDADDYDIYPIYDDTEEGYPYPLKDKTPNFDNALLHDIIDNNIKVADISSIETDGLINLSKVSDKTKSIYFIAIPRNAEDVLYTTNTNNQLQGISISNLINLTELSSFYPFNIEIIATDTKLSEEKYTTMLNIRPTDEKSSANFINKKMEISFYKSNNGNKIPLQTITVYNDTPVLSIDISAYRDILEINDNDYIMYDYDVYDNVKKSPTSYLDNIMRIVHN